MAPSPLLAGRVNAVAELAAIRLVQSRFELNRDAPDDMAYDATMSVAFSWSRSDDRLVYTFEYEFRPSREDVEPSVELLQLDITYQIGFLFPAEIEASDAEMEAYGHHTVVMMLHPYVRELVSSTAARAGLPPLVIPVLHRILGPDEVPSLDEAQATD